MKCFNLSFALTTLVLSLSSSPIVEKDEFNTIQRVIVIGLDGAGSFHQTIQPPAITKFLHSGAYCNHATNQFPTMSAENWGSIITGVNCTKHKLTNSNISNKPYSDESPYPTTFKSILNKYPGSAVGSFVEWSPINKGLIEPSIADKMTHFNTNDDALADKIVEYIEENNYNIKYLFIQLSNIDYAGHNHGFNGTEYREAYLKTDANVAKILEALDDNDLSPSSLVIMTADHGGKGYGHGGPSYNESHVLFGARGPGIKVGQIPDEKVANYDAPALALKVLDIPLHSQFDGRIPDILE